MSALAETFGQPAVAARDVGAPLTGTAWLVTGGAGYLGSRVVAALASAGAQVVVLDDLSTGDRSRIGGVPFVHGSVLDKFLVARLLRERAISGIAHIAGKNQVAESMAQPLFYYREHVEGMAALLQAATDVGVPSLVFSSTAAVRGVPDVAGVDGGAARGPASPYATTKLVAERMVEQVAAATGLRYVTLRCANVAGAARPDSPDGEPNDLVNTVFQRLDRGFAPEIFGNDYPTPDGTCVRDFVHVEDVASAHLAAARALHEGRVSALTANVGRGAGVSVGDVIAMIRRITGTDGQEWSEPVVTSRRRGDAARVVAPVDATRSSLGWEARYGLEDMVSSAWAGWRRSARAVRTAVPSPRAGERPLRTPADTDVARKGSDPLSGSSAQRGSGPVRLETAGLPTSTFTR